MGLLWEIVKSLSEQEDKKEEERRKKLEKECDKYCLFDYEKEQVMKGNFDPCDFVEPGEYDNDYYNDK